MQRALTNAEKKVQQLEAKIADFEARMALTDFFLKPDHQKVMNDYNKTKEDLEVAMAEWMVAQEALEG